MATAARLRQLRALLPALALGWGTALLWAHDATWSIVLGLVVLLLAVGAGINAVNGRFAVFVAVPAVLLLVVGSTMTLWAWWMRELGDVGTATVSEVQHHVRRSTGFDDYALRLADGDQVAGPLRDYRTGALHVGDTVQVRYDPTGVIRFPRELDDDRSAHDDVMGPIAAGAGLVLLVVGSLRAPVAVVPDRSRRSVSVADLRRRLDEERGGDPPDRR